VNRIDVRRLVNPVLALLWGTVVRCIQVKGDWTNLGMYVQGFGTALIVFGAFRVSFLLRDESLARSMQFVRVVAILLVIQVALNRLLKIEGRFREQLDVLFSCVHLAAISVLCAALGRWCRETGLSNSSFYWRLASLSILGLHLIPTALLGIASWIFGPVAGINLSPYLPTWLWLSMLVPLLFPWLVVLISLSEMQVDARGHPDEPTALEPNGA
jgi:hypothetical protein